MRRDTGRMVLDRASRELGVHRNCMLLTLLGRRLDLDLDCQLSDPAKFEGLKTLSTIHCTLQMDRFPEGLGPFSSTFVPIEDKDLTLSLCRPSPTWSMDEKVAKKYSIKCPYDYALFSDLSPLHEVTLPADVKKEAKISESAAFFCWAYPVPKYEELGLQEAQPAVASFLQVGGYLYLDNNGRLVSILTLAPPSHTGIGFQFKPWKPWHRSWTATLQRQGRWHETTLKHLTDAGATHFAWLRPHERMRNEAIKEEVVYLKDQPDIPHGAFVYLFHKELHTLNSAVTGDGEDVADRYFAISGPDDREMEAAKLKQTFAEESEFQVVNSTLFQSRGSSGGVVRGDSNPSIPRFGSGFRQLVEIVAEDLLLTLRRYLKAMHKVANNWTRDRGCNLHGVNGCQAKCSFANKAPVPTEYVLHKAYRNQNEDLWQQYCHTRDAIMQQHEGVILEGHRLHSSAPELGVDPLVKEANEQRLFHGASWPVCVAICNQGFKLEQAGKGSTWKPEGDEWASPLYGFGIYLAEYLTKADEYAKPLSTEDAVFSVLVCRVVCGMMRVIDTNDIRSDILAECVLDNPSHNAVLGDRVTKLKKPYREVVVYETKQVYPEFVLQYKRVYSE